MNIYNSLSKVLTIATLIVAFSEYALSSELDQSEFEVVHSRLGTSGIESPFRFKTYGLSGAEPTHQWTEGTHTRFTISPHSENKRCSRIIFKDVGALVANGYGQNVTIKVNHNNYQTINFNEFSARQTIEVLLPHDLSREHIIDFILPNACQPRVLDPTNGDPRRLALAFGAVDLIYEKAQYNVVNMGTNKIQPLAIAAGFSDGEGGHRWLTGKRAHIAIPYIHEGNRISQITFDTLGLVSLDSDKVTQRLIVSGNGITTREYVYNRNNPSHKVTIDLPWYNVGSLQLIFDTPDACNPRVLDANNLDGRELSVAFKNTKISYFKPPISWKYHIQNGNLIYPNVTNHLDIIGANKLHKLSLGEGSKVIVIDDGVDISHSSLSNNLSANTKMTSFSSPIEHGTLVSGIVKSVAPQAQLEVISITNANTICLSTALRSAATKSGSVVNLSRSFFCLTGNDVIIPNYLVDDFEAVVKSGTVVMISFANSYNDHSRLPDFGKKYSQKLIDMARNPRLMGRVRLVTNLSYESQNDEILHHTSNRAILDCPFAISAPGTTIYSTAPNNQHAVCTGTSMSAAILSGSYALLKSAIPGLEPEQYLDLLDRSARKYSRSGVKFDETYGVGVVDVHAAYKLYQLECQASPKTS